MPARPNIESDGDFETPSSRSAGMKWLLLEVEGSTIREIVMTARMAIEEVGLGADEVVGNCNDDLG